MQKMAIANTCYEWEIESNSCESLSNLLCSHQIFMQLQYLSFLYAKQGDIALCTHHPEPDFLARLSSLGINREYALLSSTFAGKCELDLWGASRSMARWAEDKDIPFSMPSWETVREVNSKIFSFINSPKLERAELISDKARALEWISSFKGAKVFKSAYGLSGRGNRIVGDTLDDRTLQFLQRQWQNNMPVVAEPWVDRLLDFSTQWYIHQELQIEYLGATICHNDAKGSYQKTEILPFHDIGNKYSHYLERHKEEAFAIAKLMASKGYFGHVGIDAMIYGSPSAEKLHPIVEINARKTMGYVALALQKKLFTGKVLSIFYTNEQGRQNLLPSYVLTAENNRIPFKKTLAFEVKNF